MNISNIGIKTKDNMIELYVKENWSWGKKFWYFITFRKNKIPTWHRLYGAGLKAEVVEKPKRKYTHHKISTKKTKSSAKVVKKTAKNTKKVRKYTKRTNTKPVVKVIHHKKH